MTPDVLIRPATLEDRSFIIDSWLRSYRNSEFGRRIPDDVWYAAWGHGGFVEAAVSVPGSVLVACLPSDPSFVYGFRACGYGYQPDPAMGVLHYVYVKKDFRRAGIARQLLAGGVYPCGVTHETPAWKAFAAKHGIAYEYRHPYRKER